MNTKQVVRHESHCSVCGHPQRQEIEQQFIEWVPQSRIARDFGLSSRLAVWRHALAFNLVPRRNANIRAVLARIIERGLNARVTAAVVVQACSVFAKLDAEGRSVERIQNVSGLSALFSRMTRGEAAEYATTGRLPDWWPSDTPQREGDSPNG